MAGKRKDHREAGMRLVRFIEDHFDMVNQDEYFDMCEMVLDLVEDLADREGWLGELVSDSYLYEVAEKRA